MNFTVIGCGYVGLSTAAILAENNNVTIWDIDEEKLHLIEHGTLPFNDISLERVLSQGKLHFRIPHTKCEIYDKADIFIIAVPTDYNEQAGRFDTSVIESVLNNIVEERLTLDGLKIIIKSTIPIGYTRSIRVQYGYEYIFYLPEFLREGHAFGDCKNPNRVVVGGEEQYIGTIVEQFNKNDAPVMYMSLEEAEAVKLFSNAFLAMRVAFFNEVDSFSENMMINTSNIIKGISADPRIGDYYNNPSFGYGGYCLPKDTKQLLECFAGKDNCLMTAIVESNAKRKEHIIQHIIEAKKKNIGIYRITMKMDSDNFRQSAMFDVMTELAKLEYEIVIYEPLISSNEICFENRKIRITKTLDELNYLSDIILANRLTEELEKYKYKVYSRDVYHRD